MNRRSFLGLSLFATGGAALGVGGGLPHAPRPKPPYRVWFQPRLFLRDASLYENMTIDASGWMDPVIAAALGKTTLDWTYGPNHPDATGPAYWEKECSAEERTHPRRGGKPGLISAGIALDEWVPPAKPENPEWLATGLRAGRKANPEIFVAVWQTDPTPLLFELVHDGTVDLLIIEGYTHSVKAGLSTSWENALRRCAKNADGGVIEKTIFSFGHITSERSHRGELLSGKEIRERAEEIRRRYPQMPGIAFFEPECPDTPEQRELIRHCDRLSAELWPDA